MGGLSTEGSLSKASCSHRRDGEIAISRMVRESISFTQKRRECFNYGRCRHCFGYYSKFKIKEYWDGELKWITPAEIEEESFIISDTVRHITEDGRNSANLTLLPVGSVLFSTRAPIGKVAIAGEEMYCNQGFKNFICKPELNNVFLYYTLRLNKEYLVSLGTGTTFKELSKKIVESIKISVPAKEQQEQFERVFRQSDKSKYYVQNKQNYICHILTNQIQ